MKLNKMLIIAGMMFASGVTQFAHAQAEKIGNGGDVVSVNGKYYLLDLVEAGNEKSSAQFLADKIKSYKDSLKNNYVPSYITNNYQKLESIFGDDVATGLAAMLSGRMNQGSSLYVATGILLYSWRFLNVDLENVGDEHTSIDTNKYPLEQAAVRRDRSIQINKRIYDSLDVSNKVALILHEILYAFLTPNSDGGGNFNQYSWEARQMVGDTFKDTGASINYMSYQRNGKSVVSFGQDTDFLFTDVSSIYFSDSSQVGHIAFFRTSPMLIIKLEDGSAGWSIPMRKEDGESWAENRAGSECTEVFQRNLVKKMEIKSKHVIADVGFLDINSSNGISQRISGLNSSEEETFDFSKMSQSKTIVIFLDLNECKEKVKSAVLNEYDLLIKSVGI